MNKQILMLALLVSGTTAFSGTLKKRLANHNEKIQKMKHKVRAGETLAVQDDCSGSGSGSGSGSCTGAKCDGGGCSDRCD